MIYYMYFLWYNITTLNDKEKGNNLCQDLNNGMILRKWKQKRSTKIL